MYYKVVNLDLTSAYVGNLQINKKGLVVQYKINDWVYPKIAGSNLMVFDNLGSAKYFRNHGWGYYIFECEVLNPSKYGLFVPNADSGTVSVVANLRSKRKKYLSIIENSFPNWKNCIPEGTVFCKGVKLLKIVS